MEEYTPTRGLMFGSLEWGVLQHMEITLDGLIWDLVTIWVFSIMDLAMCDLHYVMFE